MTRGTCTEFFRRSLVFLPQLFRPVLLTPGSLQTWLAPDQVRSSQTAGYALRPLRFQVEANIVEQERRIVRGGQATKFCKQLLAESRFGNALEMAAQNHALHKLLELVRIRKQRWSVLKAAFDRNEARAAQTLRREFGGREFPRRFKPGQVRCISLGFEKGVGSGEETGQIAGSATLRVKPPAWAQRAVEPGKELIVILDPVERRGAENNVVLRRQVEMLQIRPHKTHPAAELGRKMLFGGAQHVFGKIESGDPAARQRFEQVAREAAGATARVEHMLITAQWDAS